MNFKRKKRTWTKKQFIFWALNFIISYSFIIGLNGTFKQAGNLMIIPILVGSFIAFLVGICYARLTKKFTDDGGAYLYIKNAFKSKALSWHAWFWEYVQAPFVMVTIIFGVLWAFHNIKSSNSGDGLDKNPWVFVLALLLFSITFLIVRRGFVSTKITLYILWFLKWFILIFAIIASFILVVKNHANISYMPSYKSTNEGFVGIISSIMTFFFAFGGIEGVVIVANDLEDNKKNIYSSILITILLISLFYIFFFYSILGGIGVNTGKDHGSSTNCNGFPVNSSSDFNPINSIVMNIFGIKSLSLGLSVGITVLILFITTCQISGKISSRLQNVWINARAIYVAADDGLLPKSFTKKNKYKQYGKALFLDSGITLILIIIFYILFRCANYNVVDSLSLYTITAFMQYIAVAIVCIKLAREKRIVVKLWEYISYYITVTGLSFLLICYFILGFLTIHNGIDTSNIGIFSTSIIFLILIIISFAIYEIGKKLNWQHSGEHINKVEEKILK